MLPLKGDVASGENPATDRPNDGGTKSTWSFHERYDSDAEFKRQVDKAREVAGTAQLTNALNRKTKLY